MKKGKQREMPWEIGVKRSDIGNTEYGGEKGSDDTELRNRESEGRLREDEEDKWT